jgi:hypothetical protein
VPDPTPTPSEPIELPWLVLQAMRKSKTFFTILANWECDGPGATLGLTPRAATDLIREILPGMTPPRVTNRWQHMWFDLSDGWALDLRIYPGRFSRTPASVRVIVPVPGENRVPTYVSDGMVYGYLPGSEPAEEETD